MASGSIEYRDLTRQPDVILDRDSRAVGGVGGATGVDLEFACHGCPRVPEVMAIDAAYRL